MNLSKYVYVLQHVITTFLLAYLLAVQSGVHGKDGLLVAGVMMLRDLRSLFDNMSDVGLSNEQKKAIADVDITTVVKRGPGRPRKVGGIQPPNTGRKIPKKLPSVGPEPKRKDDT